MRDTCFSSTPTSPLSAAKNHCFVAAIPGKWGKGGVVEVGGFIIEVFDREEYWSLNIEVFDREECWSLNIEVFDREEYWSLT